LLHRLPDLLRCPELTDWALELMQGIAWFSPRFSLLAEPFQTLHILLSVRLTNGLIHRPMHPVRARSPLSQPDFGVLGYFPPQSAIVRFIYFPMLLSVPSQYFARDYLQVCTCIIEVTSFSDDVIFSIVAYNRNNSLLCVRPPSNFFG